MGAHKEIVTEVFTYDSWPHDLRTEKAKISEEAEAVEAAPKFEPDIFTLDIFGSSYEGSAGFFR